MASLFQHPRGALVISTEAESYLINTLSVHPNYCPCSFKAYTQEDTEGEALLGAHHGFIRWKVERANCGQIFSYLLSNTLDLALIFIDKRTSIWRLYSCQETQTVSELKVKTATLSQTVGETETLLATCKSQTHIFTCFCSWCLISYKLNSWWWENLPLE